jgi:ABC-type glycerol-3-phosphate transport system substrate-binding protein
MKIKAIDKLLGLLMVLALLLGLAACGKKDAAQDSGKTASPSDSATAEPTAEPTAAQPETGFVPVEYTTAFSIEYLDKANDIKLVTDAEGN